MVFIQAVTIFQRKHAFSKTNRVSIKTTAVKLLKVSLFPKELHTLSKMNRVSIKMTAVHVIQVSLFPQELHTFAKMSYSNIKINFYKL